jgi:hypothetical protein
MQGHLSHPDEIGNQSLRGHDAPPWCARLPSVLPFDRFSGQMGFHRYELNYSLRDCSLRRHNPEIGFIEVPNRLVDMDSRKRSACYPRSSFYPLSPIPPTRESRITNTHFRVCSACMPHSQAGLCVCTTRPGFHSGLANLCTPPLHFWRQPPQLNCPSDSVLLPDFYAGVSQISSFRRVVFHCCTPCGGLPPMLDSQNKVLSAKLQ